MSRGSLVLNLNSTSSFQINWQGSEQTFSRDSTKHVQPQGNWTKERYWPALGWHGLMKFTSSKENQDFSKRLRHSILFFSITPRCNCRRQSWIKFAFYSTIHSILLSEIKLLLARHRVLNLRAKAYCNVVPKSFSHESLLFYGFLDELERNTKFSLPPLKFRRDFLSGFRRGRLFQSPEHFAWPYYNYKDKTGLMSLRP